METKDLAQKAIEFLQKYGGLSSGKDVVFSEPYHIPEFMDSLARGQACYRDDPNHYQPEQKGDRVEEDYSGIEKIIGSEQSLNPFYKRIGKSIPDDGNFVIVDVGSGFGGDFTLPFARSHPNTGVLMVDRFDIESKKHPEERLNRHLRSNGYENVRYVQKELELSVFNMLHRGKENLVYTGLNNTRNLGLITINEALNNVYTSFVALSLSRHEQLGREDPAFKIVEEFLKKQGLSDEEIQNYHGLLHHNRLGHCDKDEKYDYNYPEQARFGNVLKLLFNLAFVDLLKKNHYRVDMFATERQSYHRPDFMIYAQRGRFQLKD